jgi:hypothetical protein
MLTLDAPAPLPTLSPLALPDELVVDLACGTESLEVTAARYNLDPEQLEAVTHNAVFDARVERARRDLQENGSLINTRTKVAISDVLIPRIINEIENPDTPSDGVYKMGMLLVKLTEMDKKPQEVAAMLNLPTITINMFPTAPKQEKVIMVTNGD